MKTVMITLQNMAGFKGVTNLSSKSEFTLRVTLAVVMTAIMTSYMSIFRYIAIWTLYTCSRFCQRTLQSAHEDPLQLLTLYESQFTICVRWTFYRVNHSSLVLFPYSPNVKVQRFPSEYSTVQAAPVFELEWVCLNMYSCTCWFWLYNRFGPH